MRATPERRAGQRRGAALVEALVGAMLAGIAAASLAAVAALATGGLRLARDTSAAVALAGERLEALRAGPRGDGRDVVPGPAGTRFQRSWHVEGGRGGPTRLSVEVGWGPRVLRLDTEALP